MATTTSVSRDAPAATGGGRISALDMARGVAILGTLATNVWIFMDPAGMLGILDRPPPSVTDGFSAATEAVFRALANGKFLGMLTLMFGIGLAIQHRSAQRKGQRWPGRYPWRATLLLIDGIVHYVLVVEFDVLTGYAITGMVVAFLLVTSPRAQRAWMWALGSIHVVLIGLLTLALSYVGGGERTDLATFTLYTEGSWWQQVMFRLENPGLLRFEPVLIMAMSITLFLLGSALFRAGLFEERGRRLRRVLLLVGAVALPVDLAVGLALGQPGFFLSRYGTAPFVALGLLGAVAMAVERRSEPGFVSRRLTDIGRVALSSYVLQNLVASFLCYGWGLGLAARLWPARPWPTLLVFAIVCTVVATFAHLWLRRFDKGPLEALWAWAYARPWRRKDARAADRTP